MKKLKKTWDKINPEYSFLNDKNLRDEASRIQETRVFMETEYINVSSNNNSQVEERPDYRSNYSETANNVNCDNHKES